MSNASTIQSQTNCFNTPSRQCTSARHSHKRIFLSCSASLMILATASLNAAAEDLQKKPPELGTTSSSSNNTQNQSAENKVAKPKPRCMPKKPCPAADSPE